MNRAQHFIPQLHLRQFVDPTLANEHVWVYEKGKSPRHAAPKEIAHQRDFYSFFFNGERNNFVDEFFQRLEGGGAEPKLRQLATLGYLSTDRDKDFLARFIGTLSARVPVARLLVDEVAGQELTNDLAVYVQDKQRFAQEFKRLAVRLSPPMEAEKVRQLMLRGFGFQQADDFYNLRMMLDLAQKNYEALLEMDWAVWRSDGDVRFITSDNPVISILPERGGTGKPGRSLTIPEIHVIFPLNPTTCLFARRRIRGGLESVSNRRVRQVNKMLMGMAHRWVFAAENSRMIASLFDHIGGTASYGDDFYQYPTELFEGKQRVAAQEGSRRRSR